MSFDAEWLNLREPADHAARDPGLAQAFADALPPAPRIIDLGSGTGSTYRALSPLIPDASWTLTDNDPALIAEAQKRVPIADVEQIDLAQNLEAALARDADAITASALIDLVSISWLDRLVAAADGRIVYIALSYNGHETWSPPHDSDAEIFTAFNDHQRGDKGFGPSLGPTATEALAERLTACGYAIRTAQSPWRLESGALIKALADSVANAAEESGVVSAKVATWCAARRKAASCEIGHVDLLARMD